MVSTAPPRSLSLTPIYDLVIDYCNLLLGTMYCILLYFLHSSSKSTFKYEALFVSFWLYYLCSQTELVAKVEKMRQSILEGLNFSRPPMPITFPPPPHAMPFYPPNSAFYPPPPLPPLQGRGRRIPGKNEKFLNTLKWFFSLFLATC